MTRKPRHDPFEYVRWKYGLNVGRGTRVTVNTYTGKGEQPGTVTGADDCVHIQLDSEKSARRYHGNDVKIMTAEMVRAESN